MVKDKTLLDFIYPIGSIYMSVSSTSPELLIGGKWVSWGAGRVPVGVNTSDIEFNSAEKIGGEKAHKLTIQESPSHQHFVGIYINNSVSGDSVYWFNPSGFASSNTGSSNSTKVTSSGGDQAHNNLQPYITCYMWKRVA